GNTALVASVQSVIPESRRAEGNGYFSTATTVSTALGPFLAIWLSQKYGYEAVFLCAAFAGAGALTAGWFFTVHEPELTRAEHAALRSWKVSTFVDRDALRMGGVIGLAGFSVAAVMGFIALHTELRAMPTAASLFFVAYALASLSSRLLLGRIQDRRGDHVVVLPVFASFIVGLLVLALASTTAGVVISGVLIGIGFGTLLPALLATVVRKVPPARMGVATSTFYLTLDIGSGVGPVLLGLAVSLWGFSGMFLAAAGVVAVAAGCYLFVFPGSGHHTTAGAVS